MLAERTEKSFKEGAMFVSVDLIAKVWQLFEQYETDSDVIHGIGWFLSVITVSAIYFESHKGDLTNNVHLIYVLKYVLEPLFIWN